MVKQVQILKLQRSDMTGGYTDCEDCPIARAAKRHFPNSHILVGPRSVMINYKHHDILYSGGEPLNIAWLKLKAAFMWLIPGTKFTASIYISN